MNAANDDDIDEEGPTPEELVQIRKATETDEAAVDALIVGKCVDRWQKVAMIIGNSLDEYESKFPHLPYVYMQIRMLALEQAGAIELQGNVMSMRTSEVRLPTSKE